MLEVWIECVKIIILWSPSFVRMIQICILSQGLHFVINAIGESSDDGGVDQAHNHCDASVPPISWVQSDEAPKEDIKASRSP